MHNIVFPQQSKKQYQLLFPNLSLILVDNNCQITKLWGKGISPAQDNFSTAKSSLYIMIIH